MYNVIGILLIMTAAACWAKISNLWFYPIGDYNSTISPSMWTRNSWMLKYKMVQGVFINAPRNWYYKLFKLDYIERFPLSATLLVWLTDGFHLLQFIMLWCISAAVVVTHYNLLERPWWWTLCYILFYRILWSATFTVFFNLVFKK